MLTGACQSLTGARMRPAAAVYPKTIVAVRCRMLKVGEHIEKAIDLIYDLYHQANAGALELWKNDIVFTWHWWVGVGLFVLPWIFWAVVRKKESTHRLLLAGFVVLILSSFCDAVGTAMRLWDYNTQVIPLIPPYAPWDFTLLPVTAMLF